MCLSVCVCVGGGEGWYEAHAHTASVHTLTQYVCVYICEVGWWGDVVVGLDWQCVCDRLFSDGGALPDCSPYHLSHPRRLNSRSTVQSWHLMACLCLYLSLCLYITLLKKIKSHLEITTLTKGNKCCVSTLYLWTLSFCVSVRQCITDVLMVYSLSPLAVCLCPCLCLLLLLYTHKHALTFDSVYYQPESWVISWSEDACSHSSSTHPIPSMIVSSTSHHITSHHITSHHITSHHIPSMSISSTSSWCVLGMRKSGLGTLAPSALTEAISVTHTHIHICQGHWQRPSRPHISTLIAVTSVRWYREIEHFVHVRREEAKKKRVKYIYISDAYER